MSSVTDLINLANFQIEQGQRTRRQENASLGARLMAQIKQSTNDRRQQENQKKLSDMLMKHVGNLEPEYKVDAQGKISAIFKSKKSTKESFAVATKEAGERITAGEDFDVVVGELQSGFPSNYRGTTETYLRKFESAREKIEQEEKEKKTQKEIELKKAERGEKFKAFGEKIGAVTDALYPFTKPLVSRFMSGRKKSEEFTVGKIIEKDGRKYKYIGNDKWEEEF
uniref:Uncharacterized protein n=1 Tax=viral metagenome TaxID=1070528 RepID=A0A6H1ZBN1_9ZZZZ